MEPKRWYKSKTVWTAIVTVGIGGVEGISEALGQPIHIPPWLYSILAGLGLYSLRAGKKPIQ